MNGPHPSGITSNIFPNIPTFVRTTKGVWANLSREFRPVDPTLAESSVKLNVDVDQAAMPGLNNVRLLMFRR